MSGEFCIAYITCSDSEEARRIGRSLVKNRLAACVNIIPGMESLYWWKGKIEEGKEAVLLAKTRTGLMQELTAEVKRLHSYDIPCVVSVPVSEGNKEFLDWIEKETGKD